MESGEAGSVVNIRFEVLTAVNGSMLDVRVVTPCRLLGRYQHFEDKGSVLLRNFGIYLQVHMVLEPVNSTLTSSKYNSGISTMSSEQTLQWHGLVG
jgi:hypothetical protein